MFLYLCCNLLSKTLCYVMDLLYYNACQPLYNMNMNLQFMTQHFSSLIRSVLGVYCFHISLDVNSSSMLRVQVAMGEEKKDY